MMKQIVLFISLAGLCLSIGCRSLHQHSQSVTPSSHTPKSARISVAEVHSIRLEVEQIPFHQALTIRVSDFWARNHGRKKIVCSILHAGNPDAGKIRDVELDLQDTGLYSGVYSNEHEHVHGSSARVEYESDLKFPISTWISFYYH